MKSMKLLMSMNAIELAMSLTDTNEKWQRSDVYNKSPLSKKQLKARRKSKLAKQSRKQNR